MVFGRTPSLRFLWGQQGLDLVPLLIINFAPTGLLLWWENHGINQYICTIFIMLNGLKHVLGTHQHVGKPVPTVSYTKKT